MTKIKFAIIGCGSIGKRHAAVIDADPNAQLVALCDVKENVATELAELYGPVKLYTDYHQLLNETGAEIINICTPHGMHAAMTVASADAKKHILVEKPMALNIADCQQMINAAHKNKVKLMVVKQNRFNVPVRLTKEAIDSGKLGKIFMVQCNVLWNRYDGYYQLSDWRGTKSMEGGALYTQASHFIDLLVWLFGDVTKASTTLDLKNHKIEFEDCGVSSLEFSSGVMGSILWTTCVYNKNYEGSITIIGEFGTIKIGGQYLNRIEYWDVRAHPLPDNVDFSDKPNLYGKYQGTSSNHDKVISDVILGLTNQQHHNVFGEEGIKTVEAIELIYRSVR